MTMNKVACLHSLDFHLGALKSRSFKHLRKDTLVRSVGSYLMFRGIGFVSVYEIQAWLSYVTSQPRRDAQVLEAAWAWEKGISC